MALVIHSLTKEGVERVLTARAASSRRRRRGGSSGKRPGGRAPRPPSRPTGSAMPTLPTPSTAAPRSPGAGDSRPCQHCHHGPLSPRPAGGFFEPLRDGVTAASGPRGSGARAGAFRGAFSGDEPNRGGRSCARAARLWTNSPLSPGGRFLAAHRAPAVAAVRRPRNWLLEPPGGPRRSASSGSLRAGSSPQKEPLPRDLKSRPARPDRNRRVKTFGLASDGCYVPAHHPLRSRIRGHGALL